MKILYPSKNKSIEIKANLKDPIIFEKIIRKKLDVSNEDYIKIKLNNFKFSIKLRPKTSDIFAFEEIFVNEDYNLDLPNNIKTIVDAGANIGLAAIYFAKKFPSSKIISIEPEESNVNLLKYNTKNYKKITCFKAGIWNKKTNLRVSNLNTADNWGFMVEESKSKKKTIKAITISDLFKILNVEIIDLIKLDIEGSEKEVFSSNYDWLNKVRFLIVELHEKMRAGVNECFYNTINKYNFKEIRIKGKYAKHMMFLKNLDL